MFTKVDERAPEGFFEAEAAGLRWLAEAGSVPLPEVCSVGRTSISLTLIEPGSATAEGAERFGRALADLHHAGASRFGAPWSGFIGPLAMDNTGSDDWPTFYAEQRVRPFLRAAFDSGAADRTMTTSVERVLKRIESLAGSSADERPSRIHGDLWNGNVLWDRSGTAWVIDPAAHGGHRETDLAMLALFGVPHLERILAAYHEHRPLAEGWRTRVGLHQLHPLAVHAVLFGSGYGRRLGEVARALAR